MSLALFSLLVRFVLYLFFGGAASGSLSSANESGGGGGGMSLPTAARGKRLSGEIDRSTGGRGGTRTRGAGAGLTFFALGGGPASKAASKAK